MRMKDVRTVVRSGAKEVKAVESKIVRKSKENQRIR